MTNYEVKFYAEGNVTLEADDSAAAVQEALDRVLDLEKADASVTVRQVEQVGVWATSE